MVFSDSPTEKTEGYMKHEERIERLKEHISEHPTDYQAVIGLLKANSDRIEHKLYMRKVEKLKRVAEYRREYENGK